MPVLVVAVGPVLAPVAAAGLLAGGRGGDQYARDEQQVGGLPRVHAGLGGLALVGPVGVGPDRLQAGGGLGEAVGGAQHARAVGHDPLDLDAGLGGEQRAGGRGFGDLPGGAVHARVAARRDVRRDALGEDQALQEGVGGEPVGAVDAGAGDLAARVQPRDRGAAVQVGAHAAGGVVGGRGDRDRLGDRVDAVGAAGGQDGGEALFPHLGAEVPRVQVHVLGAPQLHLAGDRLGDDVARRQLGKLVLPEHEARPGGVDEMGALSPYRLGDQRLLALGVGAEEQHGGVELDELQVGDLGAGPQRQGDAVAGGDRRIGGGREDLAHAAGGEHHGGGVDGPHAVVLALAHDVQGDARRTPVVVPQQVQYERVLDGPYGLLADRLDQCAGDLGAGGVAARVGDAAAVVAALAGQRDGAGVVGVEVGAGGDQPPHRVRALGDQQAHRVLVTQARARHQRVVQVLCGGVALAEGRRDAALRPARRAVVEPRLGHHHGGEPGGGAAQGRGQARHARADDHDVRVDGPARGGRVQSYAGPGRTVRRPGHAGAPKFSGMLSIRRVVPTRAATARTASPAKPSPASSNVAGSTSAR
ncbi:hypothetical protein BX283_4662 [Streptomyces sp. TLI_146]|nr:hypothetical protein BX283_4662 [Streptomyces sp. TLI_146]